METHSAAALLRRCGETPQPGEAGIGDANVAWTQLLCRYRPRLEAGVRRALRRAGADQCRDVVEDLVQEICCRLWERRGRVLGRFRGQSEGQAGCYLYRLAENTAVDVLRAGQAKKRRAEWGHGGLAAADSVPTAEANPEQWTLGRERRRLVLARLRALCRGPQSRRNSWILRRALIDGWTTDEIAGVLGKRAGYSAVQTLVFRARRQLAQAGIEVSRR